MPSQLLPYTPVYCIVGIYRLCTDRNLWEPIWRDSEKAIKRAAIISAVWAPLSYPFTKFFVRYFVKPVSLQRWKDESQMLGMSMITLATLGLLLGQVSAIFEYMLFKRLKKARIHAYERTVESRGKDEAFWGPYQEEWKEPPIDRARRYLERRPFYNRLNGFIVRTFILRVMLFPLAFIPFLPTVVLAAIRSLTLAEHLQKPFFQAKGMSEEQQATFVVERLIEFRSFGMVASLLERLPIAGLVFSISNRIGAAMWAHDLQKHQARYANHELKPEQVYVSKTAAIPAPDAPGMAGGFPGKVQSDVKSEPGVTQRRVPPKPEV